MGRKAKLVTIDELRHAINRKTNISENCWNGKPDFDIHDLRNACLKLDEDLNKIEFDMENFECSSDDEGEPFGFQTINGLTFVGCYAGGDWEHPIYFIIYMDPKGQIRGYIPEDGNIYNKTTKTAFGNDGASDEVATRRQYGFVSDYDEEINLHDLPYFDFEAILADITSRIEVEGYTPVKPAAVVAYEQQTNPNVKTNGKRKIIILED